MFAAGHCLCGAVQFSVTEPPIRMAQCHCEHCRRLTGTGHNTMSFFKRDAVTMSGPTSTFEITADSGNIRRRHFCTTCGSRMFAEGPKTPEIIGIPVGLFDDASWFRPGVILFANRRYDWDPIDPDIETHEAM